MTTHVGAIFHKIYLVTQALILITGSVFFTRLVYVDFYDSETNEKARVCSLRAIRTEVPLGIMETYSDKWTSFLRAHIMLKGSFKEMKAEADRITKACSSLLLIDVYATSGEISLSLVKGDGEYRPAIDREHILYAMAYVFGGTALLSLALFAIRKWIGIVFRSNSTS